MRRLVSPALWIVVVLPMGILHGAALVIPEAVLNEGGNERSGFGLTLTNDALGDAVSGVMTSSSGRFRIEPYSSSYRPICPPGEVQNLHVDAPGQDPVIDWDPDVEAEWYNVYREQFWTSGQVPPPVFDGHVCRNPLPGTHDAETPPVGELFAYLVTAANVYYESTLGTASDGSTRTKGTPCP